MFAKRFFAEPIYTIEGELCTLVLALSTAKNRLVFIGSNLPASLKRNERGIVLKVALRKGQRGLLAYVIETNDSAYEFLTEVSFATGKPIAMLDETFMCALPDRFGQVVDMGVGDGYCLRVNAHVGNKTELREYINQHSAKGAKVVMDTGLLCAFLLGDTGDDMVNIDKLEAAAEDYVAEESARNQLVGKQNEIEALRGKLMRKEGEFNFLEGEYKCLQVAHETLAQQAADRQKELNARDAQAKAGWTLWNTTAAKWLKSRELKDALEEFARNADIVTHMRSVRSVIANLKT